MTHAATIPSLTITKANKIIVTIALVVGVSLSFGKHLNSFLLRAILCVEQVYEGMFFENYQRESCRCLQVSCIRSSLIELLDQ